MPKPKSAHEVALSLLARREHSAAELTRKLTQRGYGEDEVEALIARLQQSGSLSDERYAEARARTRAECSKWGPQKIRQELAAQGVDADTAAAAMRELDEKTDWLQTAVKLLARKYPLPPEGERDEVQKEVNRRMAFLQRRGFTAQQALQALKTHLPT